jgi:anti-sigma factor RsiW
MTWLHANPCDWTQARLPLLAGGELAGSDRRETERHLITCPDCRHQLQRVRSALSVLRDSAAWPDPVVDDRPLWPPLRRQIRETRREVKPRIAVRLGMGVALAASLALVAFGVWQWTSRNALSKVADGREEPGSTWENFERSRRDWTSSVAESTSSSNDQPQVTPVALEGIRKNEAIGLGQ